MPFPLGDQDLAAAEAALGVRFPESYRRKMLADNGGEASTTSDDFELFRVLDRTDRKRLARTSSNEIVRENELARSWRGFPGNAIAIGEDGSGNFLVFLVEEGAAGPVFVWDHETALLERVASDFADLLPDKEHR